MSAELEAEGAESARGEVTPQRIRARAVAPARDGGTHEELNRAMRRARSVRDKRRILIASSARCLHDRTA